MSSINTKAAIRILTSIKTSYLINQSLLDMDGKSTYGTIDLFTKEDISKQMKNNLVVIISGNDKILVGKEHKKTQRALAERRLVPEGMVKFPSSDLVIITAYVNNHKESSKLLSRLVPEDVTDIAVSDGAFFLKDLEDEWFALPFVHSENPNLLQWAVRDNHVDTKVAFVFTTQEEAFDKLRSLAASSASENAKKAA